MSLSFEPMPGQLGAFARGWEPNQALDARDIDSIKVALAKFSVLVFRGHAQPSDAQLVTFATAFGELIQGSVYFGDNQQFPEILRVNNLKDKNGYPLGTGGSEAADWHSDYSFLPRYGTISFLDAIEVPAGEGRTYFASAYTAYERLDEAERRRLSNLDAYHDTLAADRNIRVEEAKKKDAEAQTEIPVKPSVVHPLVIAHPDTGREALYVNPMLTRYIVGMSAEESHEILERSFRHMTEADNIYAHEWQAGDMVVFDNIGLVHRRDGFDPHKRRSMRQLTTLREVSN